MENEKLQNEITFRMENRKMIEENERLKRELKEIDRHEWW